MALVVGHKTDDIRETFGSSFKVLVEGQNFNRTKFDRVYTAVAPTSGFTAWWERLRSQTKDRRIHTLR